MDHRYIDQFEVPERYLNHALRPEERAAFEAHVVDCQECTDRVLLAEMFHARNGLALHAEENPVPLRVRFVARLRPWQLMIVVICVILLLAIPTVLFSLWVG